MLQNIIIYGFKQFESKKGQINRVEDRDGEEKRPKII